MLVSERCVEAEWLSVCGDSMTVYRELNYAGKCCMALLLSAIRDFVWHYR